VSDMAGYAARVAVERSGSCRDTKATTSLPPAVSYDYNGATGKSDIEGKATRVGVSERGKQPSFKPSALSASRAFPFESPSSLAPSDSLISGMLGTQTVSE